MSSTLNQQPDRKVMLSHEMVWDAVDRLAGLLNLTPSGLARLAGLDSTSFNRSKRFKADGRPRWPSTESVAKILDASGTSASDFFSPLIGNARVNGENRSWSEVNVLTQNPNPDWPVLEPIDLVKSKAKTKSNGVWQNRAPVPSSSQAIIALMVTGDEFMPVYREGSQLLLANDMLFSEGDRVLVHCGVNDLILGDVNAIRSRSLSLSQPSREGNVKTFALSSVEWVARIIWASQ